jgi:CRP-like cAMP-binding protein
MAGAARAANALLKDMARPDYLRVFPHLVRVDLSFAQVLADPARSPKYVYFPISGLIAVHTPVVNGVSTGLVGNEGMVGALVSATSRDLHDLAVVHGEGTSMRIESRRLRQVSDISVSLQRQMHRYTWKLLQSASQQVLCTGLHALEARLVRCLLEASDRAHSEELRLTQQFLAQMIGAERSGVSVAASSLRRRNLIEYARGRLRIVDRVALRGAACSCYFAP